jgi:hypothetical protein
MAGYRFVRSITSAAEDEDGRKKGRSDLSPFPDLIGSVSQVSALNTNRNHSAVTWIGIP